MTYEIELPYLGKRRVREWATEPGHYVWLDAFGWHDCTRDEDDLIRSAIPSLTPNTTKDPSWLFPS